MRSKAAAEAKPAIAGETLRIPDREIGAGPRTRASTDGVSLSAAETRAWNRAASRGDNPNPCIPLPFGRVDCVSSCGKSGAVHATVESHRPKRVEIKTPAVRRPRSSRACRAGNVGLGHIGRDL